MFVLANQSFDGFVLRNESGIGRSILGAATYRTSGEAKVAARSFPGRKGYFAIVPLKEALVRFADTLS